VHTNQRGKRIIHFTRKWLLQCSAHIWHDNRYKVWEGFEGHLQCCTPAQGNRSWGQIPLFFNTCWYHLMQGNQVWYGNPSWVGEDLGLRLASRPPAESPCWLCSTVVEGMCSKSAILVRNMYLPFCLLVDLTCLTSFVPYAAVQYITLDSIMTCLCDVYTGNVGATAEM